MKSAARLIFVLLVLGAGPASCAPLSSPARRLPAQAPLWFDQAGRVEVYEARFGADTLYFRFRIFSPEKDVVHEYAVKAPLGCGESAPRNPCDPARPMTLLTDEQWQQLSEDLEPVKTMGQDYGEQFYHGLLVKITPEEPQSAALVNFGPGERVFYYGPDDRLKVVDLAAKPEDIVVTRTYSSLKLSRLLVGSLKAYFKEQGLDTRYVVLNVPHERGVMDPFVFVDLEKELTLSLRADDPRLERYRMGLLDKGRRAADQLLWQSHFLGLLRRPVSSAYRLVVAGAESTYEILNPRVTALMEASDPPALSGGPPLDLQDFEDTLDRITGTRSSPGMMDFYIGGEAFFPELIQRLQAARKSVKIRIFIFDRDDYGVKLADLLKEKSRQGVKVKVLLDSIGILMGENHISGTLPAGFTPPRSMVEYLRQDSKVRVRVRPSPWLKADHVKTIIVDDEIVYTGGMNIGREYRFEWHDMMMDLRGPVTAGIVRDFNEAWAHASWLGDLGYFLSRLGGPKPRVKDREGYPVRVLYTRPNDPQIFKAQLAAIRAAREYIYIHNPYFSDNTVLFELIQARRRGVDVRVVLPARGNHEIMNASNVVTTNAMLRNGIRVFLYPGMTHVKAAIYDGWLCAGSANLDKLSLKDNLEMNVATAHPQAVEYIRENLFKRDFAVSAELRDPLPATFREYFAKFFASHL